jgi:hypothetical protein
MIYTKKKFGLELKMKIERGNNCNDISKWAFKIYTDYGLDFENGLDYFVLKLIAMDEGPEFFLSKDELKLLANELIGISKNNSK